MQGIGDIVERDSSQEPPKPPFPPKPKAFTKSWTPRRRPVVVDPTATPTRPAPRAAPATGATSAPGAGTPIHTGAHGATTTSPSGAFENHEEQLSDAERVHLENIRKMQQMSPEEIQRNREEIFRTMDPAVLQSLLRRAELKETQYGGATTNAQLRSGGLKLPSEQVTGTRAPPRGSMAEWDPVPGDGEDLEAQANIAAQANIKEISENHTNKVEPDDMGVHFPPPPDDLRKYFPDLPAETEKLAWMKPIDDSEEAEYSSELVSVAPSELRFDFKGNLITPRMSRLIPTTQGLHHHGDAPSAAGYTLPELAHLARSSHPAQRAMAIRTAGRVLHKLRLKQFNKSIDLQEGLEQLVRSTRIMDTLAEAADESTRSVTVRTLATEALWLANTNNSGKASK